MANNFDNHFAIIVGIDNYGQSSISSLQSAQKDASDLHNYLTKFGGYKTDNVKLITGDKATKHTIDTCIDEYKGKFTNDSTLLFYFSGHGSNLSGDFILPLYNFNKNAEVSFFNSEELIKLFSEINVKKLLFLFDTCYSGILAREKDADTNDIEEDNATYVLERLVETDINNSRVLIASSLPNQTSYEIKNGSINNGIFTHCLLKTLRGHYQIKKKPDISILELSKSLIENVPALACEHKINQNCCMKTSILCEDFSVCYSLDDIEEKTLLPSRYIEAVIDLQEDGNMLMKQFVQDLSNGKVDSKFTYWGQEVTQKYIQLLNSSQYTMPQITAKLISQNIADIIKHISSESRGLRVISLGIGDGYKDAIILKKICEDVNVQIDYWIMEFSYEMLKIGWKNVQERLGATNCKRITPKLFQTDFMNVNILENLLSDKKVNLFLLLGNTLGNFQEDALLKTISSVMHNGDYFLIDNQIKNEKPLTRGGKRNLKSMYDTDEYKSYILSILNTAHIKSEDGKIATRIINYEADNAILRKYECCTVKQEFTFSVDKTVVIEGNAIEFRKDQIIPVIYSRKYTKNALSALLKQYLEIVEPYYSGDKYALILCQKQ